ALPPVNTGLAVDNTLTRTDHEYKTPISMLSFIINFLFLQLDEHMIRTDFGRTILLWIKKIRYSLFPFILY
ncbi:MAG: hypothetical protein ACLU4N_17725, partial [Butyricimonas faecihominis]